MCVSLRASKHKHTHTHTGGSGGEIPPGPPDSAFCQSVGLAVTLWGRPQSRIVLFAFDPQGRGCHCNHADKSLESQTGGQWPYNTCVDKGYEKWACVDV